MSHECMNRVLLRSVRTLCLCVILTASAAAEEKPGPEEYTTRLMKSDLDGSNLSTVMDLPGYLANGSPDCSRDGRLIAIDAWQPDKGETYANARIVVFNKGGTNIRILGDGAMPSFSPQGKRVAYSRYSPNRGIWVQDVDDPDSEPILLDEDGWGTAWSPDGTRIVFSKRTRSGANLCVYSLVEGTREFLLDEGASPYRQIYWNFAWSPDGQSIALRGDRSDGTSELAVVDAGGTAPGLTSCLKATVDAFLSWTPDGKVLFSRGVNQKSQLFTLDPKHPEIEPVQLPIAPDHSKVGGVFSADGKEILFIMRRPLPDFAKK